MQIGRRLQLPVVMIIQIFLVLLLACRTSSHCFHGNAEPTCQYTCHCAGDAQCDLITGTCPLEECDETPGHTPWHGPGCQLGNVAIGGKATATYTGNNPEQCIDDIDNIDDCSAGPNEGSFLEIDLRDDYAVDYVYVMNSAGSASASTVSLLDVNGTTLGASPERNFNAFGNNVGRFVKIINEQLEEGFFNEIYVVGYRYRKCVQQADGRFYYGPGCLLPCAEGCAEQCDMITGDSCTVCHPGYQGYGCLEKCRQGHWGDNCMFSCDCPDESIDCDHVTGECPNED